MLKAVDVLKIERVTFFVRAESDVEAAKKARRLTNEPSGAPYYTSSTVAHAVDRVRPLTREEAAHYSEFGEGSVKKRK